MATAARAAGMSAGQLGATRAQRARARRDLVQMLPSPRRCLGTAARPSRSSRRATRCVTRRSSTSQRDSRGVCGHRFEMRREVLLPIGETAARVGRRWCTGTERRSSSSASRTSSDAQALERGIAAEAARRPRRSSTVLLMPRQRAIGSCSTRIGRSLRDWSRLSWTRVDPARSSVQDACAMSTAEDRSHCSRRSVVSCTPRSSPLHRRNARCTDGAAWCTSAPAMRPCALHERRSQPCARMTDGCTPARRTGGAARRGAGEPVGARRSEPGGRRPARARSAGSDQCLGVALGRRWAWGSACSRGPRPRGTVPFVAARDGLLVDRAAGRRRSR